MWNYNNFSSHLTNNHNVGISLIAIIMSVRQFSQATYLAQFSWNQDTIDGGMDTRSRWTPVLGYLASTTFLSKFQLNIGLKEKFAK